MDGIARPFLLCAALVSVAGSGLVEADAGPLATNVAVKVEIASSSGVCGVRTGTLVAGVTCGPMAQTVVGGPGSVSFQRIGIVPGSGVAREPLPLYADSTKFTSWRIVQLNNADYVELTIVW
jgi:hypothetical protein